MDVLKRVGSSFTGLAGKTKGFLGQKQGDGLGGYELAGVDVLREGAPPFGDYKPESFGQAAQPASPVVELGAILRLRSFLYLVAATGGFLFQISSTLAINDLARRNERLREELRISTSITTAQELQLRQLQSIRNISAPAGKLGLKASPVPPVELRP